MIHTPPFDFARPCPKLGWVPLVAPRHLDTHEIRVKNGPMTTKMKRTYNLSVEVVTHVRDLTALMGNTVSQDRVVEMAVERLYRELRDREEAAAWADAAADAEFRSEMREIASGYGDRESWPA
jgi:hypothetical protein